MTAIAEAATAGVRLETLRRLRDRIAADIDVCDSARDVAALSLRLMDVLEQIDDLAAAEPQPAGTPLDEFSKRLAERNAAPGKARAASRGKRR